MAANADTSYLYDAKAPPPVTGAGGTGTGYNPGGFTDKQAAYSDNPMHGGADNYGSTTGATGATTGTGPAGGTTYAGGTGTGAGAGYGATTGRSPSLLDRARGYGVQGYDQFARPGRVNKGLGPEHNVWLALLAILLPPLAVFLRSGFGVDFIINICLTILAWFPGILHAWFVICMRSSGSGVQRDTRTNPL